MTTVVDTSVLIDVLRGRDDATDALERARARGRLHSSEITRVELLSGMRRGEEVITSALTDALVWHPLDESIAEIAGGLGRQWRPSHGGIDAADLIIAATAIALNSAVLTRNTRHFPMFDGLTAPY